jgi:hemerythrin-like domain-containing protein
MAKYYDPALGRWEGEGVPSGGSDSDTTPMGGHDIQKNSLECGSVVLAAANRRRLARTEEKHSEMSVQIGQTEPGFDDPVGLLVACHRRIERFLAVLVDLAMRGRGHTLNNSERDAMETALRYFRDAAPHHTADEERGLFPALGKLRTGGERIISELEGDHRKAEELHWTVDRVGLLWITHGTLAERGVLQLQAAVGELSALYLEHIGVEEEHIFPTARTVLSRLVLEDIGRGMAARRGIPYIPAIVTAIASPARALC